MNGGGGQLGMNGGGGGQTDVTIIDTKMQRSSFIAITFSSS